MRTMEPRQRLQGVSQMRAERSVPPVQETARLHLSHAVMAGALFMALAALILYLWGMGL